LIDTHAHLSRQDIYIHARELINEAQREGLLGIINVTTSLKEIRNALRIIEEYRGFVFTALGYDYESFDVREVQEIMNVIIENKDLIIGIGEVGLDYNKVRDPILRELSRHIFVKWIKITKELDKPLIIHSRDAENDVTKLLAKHGPVRCIAHAFSGNRDQARRLLDLGCYFSIPPTIVRSQQKRDLVLTIPLNRLLLESDTPELGPSASEPSRPVHIKLVLKELSELLSMDVDELNDIIIENTLRAFPTLSIK
jgi:TatD DNase family protein